MSCDQDSEALYWLDIAKRVLNGEISPDEASHVLRLGALNLEASEIEGDEPQIRTID
jgi:hypothetical protein